MFTCGVELCAVASRVVHYVQLRQFNAVVHHQRNTGVPHEHQVVGCVRHCNKAQTQTSVSPKWIPSRSHSACKTSFAWNIYTCVRQARTLQWALLNLSLHATWMYVRVCAICHGEFCTMNIAATRRGDYGNWTTIFFCVKKKWKFIGACMKFANKQTNTKKMRKY